MLWLQNPILVCSSARDHLNRCSSRSSPPADYRLLARCLLHNCTRRGRTPFRLTCWDWNLAISPASIWLDTRQSKPSRRSLPIHPRFYLTLHSLPPMPSRCGAICKRMASLFRAASTKKRTEEAGLKSKIRREIGFNSSKGVSSPSRSPKRFHRRSRGLSGARSRRRRQILPGHTRLPTVLVWRHEWRTCRLGSAASAGGPTVDRIPARGQGCVEVTPRHLGILNHFSLGVPDMKASAKLLESRGWTPTEGSRMQMGKDGKWQLNVYDPDGTGVELMEFTPTEKPCCSPFTAPHPTENE